jgi:hypothetical protein
MKYEADVRKAQDELKEYLAVRKAKSGQPAAASDKDLLN